MKRNKNSAKITHFLKNKGKVEYIVEETDTKKGKFFELRYGTNPSWVYPLQLVATLLDTGNGVILKIQERGTFKKGFDYSEAEYMRILLEFTNRDQGTPSRYKVTPGKYKL